MSALSIDSIRRLLDGAFERQDLYTGDSDLNPGLESLFSQAHRPAAVLILLVERPEGLTVLLTERPKTLRLHAGQISFPGGGVEPADNGPASTALRESQEEVGLDPALVDILGYLPPYQTRSGFTVSPVVGTIKPPFSLTINPAEVDRVLEVPLDFLLNSVNCQTEERDFQGLTARFYSFEYQGDRIWGATAGMLRGLREILSGGGLIPLPAHGFRP